VIEGCPVVKVSHVAYVGSSNLSHAALPSSRTPAL